MAINPYKSKHETFRAYKGVKFIDLKCIKDGFVRRFTDDGPHEVDRDGKPVEGWQTKTRHSGAANTLKKIREREPDPFGGPDGDDPDAVVPTFVAVGNKPVRVWDSVSRMYVESAVMTPHLEKVSEFFKAQRNQIANQANARAEKIKKEQEEKAAAGVDAILAALGERAAKASKPAPEPKPAKADSKPGAA